jgi:hypothetical protein
MSLSNLISPVSLIFSLFRFLPKLDAPVATEPDTVELTAAPYSHKAAVKQTTMKEK